MSVSSPIRCRQYFKREVVRSDSNIKRLAWYLADAISNYCFVNSKKCLMVFDLLSESIWIVICHVLELRTNSAISWHKLRNKLRAKGAFYGEQPGSARLEAWVPNPLILVRGVPEFWQFAQYIEHKFYSSEGILFHIIPPYLLQNKPQIQPYQWIVAQIS